MSRRDKQQPLDEIHGRPPLVTNAQYNRGMAMRMHAAGMTPGQIARAFPEVFACVDGKLSMHYDSVYMNDADGRRAPEEDRLLETRFMICEDAVVDEIAQHRGGGGR